ncbi:SusC/RagA family TonB-linked outer membrane protein [Dyadobacter psychrophilus]|uniref:TonB-linked outer membrane protein, SusC/RagA family n=1 Tax=Dyadobacter psychrophilus TaxID=651661 RepID=A0A1T5H563_9BACT|nr:TonB-dependent receptor [Dyadobacter psychrophilus]SKC15804.1 TonB-linked outer membrane protein, SusC/RagA family [Dyadobacter psychrophilus]
MFRKLQSASALGLMLVYGILPVGNQKVYAGNHLHFTASLVVSANGENGLSSVADITGKVTGDNGEELPGVSILLKGTTTGATTDANGLYKLTIPAGNATLVFSYVGYISQEIEVNNRSVIDVKLLADTKALEEIVVVGYGTMKKSDVTGAITSVKAKDITAIPTTNALRSLQGKVSGIDITQSSGQPGADINIVLRGNRSLRADNKPLVLVDGIPYGSFIDINPTDIASIEVLKDVASTAIYGTRGANGVIIITTKKGSAGKSTLSFNSYVSMNKKALYPRMMNGEEYAQQKREAYRTTNGDVYRKDEDIFQVTELQYIKDKQFEDWQSYIFHNGLMQNYEINLTGGSEKTTFSTSFGYQKDKGLLLNDVYRRLNGKIGVDHKLNDRFRVGLSAIYSYKNQDKRDNPLNMANKILPIAKAFNDDGTLILNPAPGYSAQFTPLADEQPGVFVNNIVDKRLFSSAYLDVKITNELFLKSTIGLDFRDFRRGYYKGYNTVANAGRNSNSGVEINNYFNYTWENTLNYNKSIGNHQIQGLLGTSSLGTKFEEYTSSGNNQASPITSFHDLNSNTISKAIGSRLRETTIASFFGRINYKLSNKYIFQASLRADGSSVLAAGNKWGYFPSVSGAWRVIEEPFLQDSKVFNDLKLRVSWGRSGNSTIDPYATKGGLGLSAYAFGTSAAYGYWPSVIPNPALTWETTGTWNAGLDFGLMGNRISGTIDVYRSRTRDLLLPSLLPTHTGYSEILENIGQVENKGVELAITTQNISGKAFNWSTDWTFTLNREKILALNNGVTRNEANSWFVGEPTKVFFDYKKIGIWQLGEEEAALDFGKNKPGDVKVADMNGNGVVDPGDRTTFSSVPKFSFGVNNHFEYKNFDLSVFVYGRIGHYINYEYNAGAYKPSALENSSNVDYWTPENPTNAFPRPNSSYSTTNYLYQSTLGYVKGSFVKIRDVSLGYNIPSPLTKKIGVGRVRVYGTLQNYFTFSKIKDYDPERGGDLSFPLVKQMIFGVNIDF